MTEILSANERLRPLGRRIVIKPLPWQPSKVIEVVRRGRPLRGVVIAAGPGDHPKKYRAGPKGPKQFMDYGRRFQPTEVKPGDVVELGGLNIFDGEGYPFPEVYIGGEKHLICSEQDVCMVVDA